MPPYDSTWRSILQTHESVVRKLLCSTYVDDIIAGGQTEEEAFNLYTQSKKIFHEGGFNLRKFFTNSKCLQGQIELQEGPKVDTSPQQDEPTYAEATLGTSPVSSVEEHKILGIPWNSESDQLVFDISNIANLAHDLYPTKRNLVGLIGKLGFLAPVIIKFKMLFQKLCQCKYA